MSDDFTFNDSLFSIIELAQGYYVQEAAAKGASFILVGTKETSRSCKVHAFPAMDLRLLKFECLQEQARPIVRKYGEEAGIHYTDLKPAIPDSQELWSIKCHAGVDDAHSRHG